MKCFALISLLVAAACSAGQDLTPLLTSIDARQQSLAARTIQPLPDAARLAQTLGSVPAIAEYLKHNIRYRAYAGQLYGHAGALTGQAGNDVDQSALFVTMARAINVECRYAAGVLSQEQCEKLISRLGDCAARPEDKAFGPDPEARARQADWAAGFTNHVWVQIKEGDAWIDIDPLFPDLPRGQSACAADATWDEIPDEWLHRVHLRVGFHVRRGEDQREVVALERDLVLADLTAAPVTLVTQVQGKPDGDTLQLAAVQPVLHVGSTAFPGLILTPEGERETLASPEKTAGDLAGRLGGIFAAADADAPANDEQPEAPAPALFEIRGEWLEVNWSGPGDLPPGFRYEVFNISEDGAAGAAGMEGLSQAIALGLTASATTQAMADHNLDRLPPLLTSFTSAARELPVSTPASGAISADLAGKAGGAFTDASRSLAWLAVEQYLLASDQALAAAADKSGVAMYHARPRAVISQVGPRQGKLAYGLDLRVNQAQAYVPVSRPDSLARHLSLFRGFYEARLEGAVLKSFSSQPPLTAGAVLQQAKAAGIPCHWIAPDRREALEALKWDAGPKQRITDAVDSGRWVWAPERPLLFEGREELGWLEGDPLTGHIEGVFANGRHQGMVEDMALNYVVGNLSGAGMGYFAAMNAGFVYGMAAGLDRFLDCVFADPNAECFGRADVCGPAAADAAALCDGYGKLTGAVTWNPLPFLGVPDLTSYVAGDPCQIGAIFGLAWFGCVSQ